MVKEKRENYPYEDDYLKENCYEYFPKYGIYSNSELNEAGKKYDNKVMDKAVKNGEKYITDRMKKIFKEYWIDVDRSAEGELVDERFKKLSGTTQQEIDEMTHEHLSTKHDSKGNYVDILISSDDLQGFEEFASSEQKQAFEERMKQIAKEEQEIKEYITRLTLDMKQNGKQNDFEANLKLAQAMVIFSAHKAFLETPTKQADYLKFHLRDEYTDLGGHRYSFVVEQESQKESYEEYINKQKSVAVKSKDKVSFYVDLSDRSDNSWWKELGIEEDCLAFEILSENTMQESIKNPSLKDRLFNKKKLELQEQKVELCKQIQRFSQRRYSEVLSNTEKEIETRLDDKLCDSLNDAVAKYQQEFYDLKQNIGLSIKALDVAKNDLVGYCVNTDPKEIDVEIQNYKEAIELTKKSLQSSFNKRLSSSESNWNLDVSDDWDNMRGVGVNFSVGEEQKLAEDLRYYSDTHGNPLDQNERVAKRNKIFEDAKAAREATLESRQARVELLEERKQKIESGEFEKEQQSAVEHLKEKEQDYHNSVDAVLDHKANWQSKIQSYMNENNQTFGKTQNKTLQKTQKGPEMGLAS